MASAEEYAKWIVDNADKKGTPEFDTVARAYTAARDEHVRDDEAGGAVSKPLPKLIGVKPQQNWKNIGAESLGEAGLKDPTVDRGGRQGTTIQGMTLGLGDEIDAGLSAASAGLKGRPMGEAYDKQLDQSRGDIADYTARHPYQAMGNAAIGGLPLMMLPLPKVTGGESLGANVVNAGAQGAGMGAAYGFNEGEGGLIPRAENVPVNAALGGLLGAAGPLASAGTGAVVKKVASLASPDSPEVRAKALLMRELERKGMSAENGGQVLEQFGDNHAIMDVAGERLGRTVNAMPGKGSEVVSKFLQDRQADQGARVRDAIAGNLTKTGDLRATVKGLQDQQKNAAGPFFKRAFEANENISDPEIDDVLGTPAGEAALRLARVKQLNAREPIGAIETQPKLEAPAGNGPAKLPKENSGTIYNAIRKYGGIRTVDHKGAITSEGGDVKEALRGLNASGIVNNKNGLAPDKIIRLLEEDGWFGRNAENGTRDLSDLYEALRQGRGFNHPERGGASSVLEENGRYLDEARTMADELGIKWTKDMTPDDINRAVDHAERGSIALDGGKPGYSLKTLHHAKRALDDDIGTALVNGRKGDAADLIALKKDLLAAMDKADVTGGDYAKGRAIWGGVARSLEAIDQGAEFLTMHPEDISGMLADMAEGDRRFAQMGAARALEKVAGRTRDGNDAVARIHGTPDMRRQIAAMFGKNRAADFSLAMSPEKIATQTNRFVRNGSDTASKLADMHENGSLVDDAVEGMVTSRKLTGAITPLVKRGVEWARARSKGMTPEVRLALAKMLIKTGDEGADELADLPAAVANSRGYQFARRLGTLPRLNTSAGIGASTQNNRQR